jgi:hypothetical protein
MKSIRSTGPVAGASVGPQVVVVQTDVYVPTLALTR